MPRLWCFAMRRARAGAHKRLCEILGEPLLRSCHRCGTPLGAAPDGQERDKLSDPGRCWCRACVDALARERRGCPFRFSPGAACRKGVAR